MTMEKTGDISDKTPQPCGSEKCGCDSAGQPITKEAADKLQSSVANDAVDAVVEKTEENQSKS